MDSALANPAECSDIDPVEGAIAGTRVTPPPNLRATPSLESGRTQNVERRERGTVGEPFIIILPNKPSSGKQDSPSPHPAGQDNPHTIEVCSRPNDAAAAPSPSRSVTLPSTNPLPLTLGRPSTHSSMICAPERSVSFMARLRTIS